MEHNTAQDSCIFSIISKIHHLLLLGIKKQSVFLDTILNAVKEGEKLDIQDIQDEVSTFLFAVSMI